VALSSNPSTIIKKPNMGVKALEQMVKYFQGAQMKNGKDREGRSMKAY
jgi:hypothetical protein